MLGGTKVRLRAVEPADYELIWRWLNNPEVAQYWGLPGHTVSLPEVRRDEESQASRGTSRKYIIEALDSTPIGEIDYYDLEWKPRSAWVSILIGDTAFWGGGFGTDAMRTLLRYLFAELGLHRVTLTVHETNARAIRSYEKNGFVREGLLRDWAFFNGRYVNGVIMSVLAADFARVTNSMSDATARQT